MAELNNMKVTQQDINKSTGGLTLLCMPNGGEIAELRIPVLEKDKRALMASLIVYAKKLEASLR